MIRTQIQLTESQSSALKELSHRSGESVAEIVRRAVDNVLTEDERAERYRRASAIIGKYSGGPSDVSERHDEYLAEDFL